MAVKTAKVAVSSATGRMVIIGMIVPAVRWPRGRRSCTASVMTKRSRSVPSVATVMTANIIKLAQTGTVTPSLMVQIQVLCNEIVNGQLQGSSRPRPREALVATGLDKRGSSTLPIKRAHPSLLRLCAKTQWM